MINLAYYKFRRTKIAKISKMIKCKYCSKEIAQNAVACPGCGSKNKKPLYKRPLFIALAVFIAIGAIGSLGSESTPTESESGQEIVKDQETEKDVPPVEVEEEVIKETEKVPTEYKSALRKAKTYSDTMQMSKAGLYQQLTSEYGEKFTA